MANVCECLRIMQITYVIPIHQWEWINGSFPLDQWIVQTMISPTFVNRRKPSQKNSQTVANLRKQFFLSQRNFEHVQKNVATRKTFCDGLRILGELFAMVCDGLQRLANVSEIMGVDP